jgi:hypothetical protein
MKTVRTLAGSLLVDRSEYQDAWIAVDVEKYILSIKPVLLRWLLPLYWRIA